MRIIVLVPLILMFISDLDGQTGKKLVLLHTNDLHSRLNGFAPEYLYTPLKTGDDKTKGGFARIAKIIEREREKSQGITLVFDAGDFLMGTLFHGLEVSTGFQLRLMKRMGYDFVAIGNHEFDFGPEKLSEIIDKSSESGEIPLLMLGNAVFDKKDPGDDALEMLFDKNIVARSTVMEKDGLKIGIFSILGKNASEVAPLAKPVRFSKVLPFAKAMVKNLQSEKCDIIICISHSGIEKLNDGSWGGEDVNLAESVKGIDLIISGHTHTKLDKPLFINGVPIVQTGEYGENVGCLELSWSDKRLQVENYTLIPVDDNVGGNRLIDSMITEQQKLIASEILQPLGIDYFKPVAESSFALECDANGDFKGSNLGPLVADAINNYVNTNTTEGADVSLVAVGIIRDKIVPGIQTPADIFRIMSLGSGKDNVPGYPLSRLFVTGKELKSVLEILQEAYKSSSDNYCFYSGIRVQYDPDRGLLKKIKQIAITKADGSVTNVDFSKKDNHLYSITANSYMLEFIGIIKKMSFGLINVVPKDSKGYPINDLKTAIIDIDEKTAGVQEGKEWLALLNLLRSMKDINGNGIPDIDDKYSLPVKSFFPVMK